MKSKVWPLLSLLLCVALVTISAAQTTNLPALNPIPTSRASTPGLEAAQSLSTVTGVAISPLLGVSAVGAWKYVKHVKTPEAQRGRLPWFAEPWFWIPGLLLVGVCFAKDVMGPAVPTALKKPFDIAELFENKISALLVAGLFVPLMASIFGSESLDGTMLQGLGLAAFEPIMLLNVFTVPAAIMIFLVVWMASHVINVLIIVSPFATVDTVLKSSRFMLLALFTLISINLPYVGALLSLLIILVAYFIAGWSFRLTVFGTVFAWDLVSLRSKRFAPKPDANWMFTARRIDKVPVRTYGRLTREAPGKLVFRYRPFLVTAAKTASLPEGPYVVGRGLLYPDVLLREGERARTMFTLPPRYRTHEEAVAKVYGLAGVEDVGIVKGLKAVWNWLKELSGFGSQTLPPAAAPSGTSP